MREKTDDLLFLIRVLSNTEIGYFDFSAGKYDEILRFNIEMYLDLIKV